jgi:two-component system, OmpR family, phosphate regulon response regulator PhoB
MPPERASVESSTNPLPKIRRPRSANTLVLVIDDDPQVAYVTRFILHRSGIHAITATSPEEGFHIAMTMHPDVILCDAALPRINGCQLLRILKQTDETASIPVILMGSHEGLDCEGIFTFLRKPFDAATLVGATQNALQQRRLAA